MIFVARLVSKEQGAEHFSSFLASNTSNDLDNKVTSNIFYFCITAESETVCDGSVSASSSTGIDLQVAWKHSASNAPVLSRAWGEIDTPAAPFGTFLPF